MEAELHEILLDCYDKCRDSIDTFTTIFIPAWASRVIDYMRDHPTMRDGLTLIKSSKRVKYTLSVRRNLEFVGVHVVKQGKREINSQTFMVMKGWYTIQLTAMSIY